MDYLNVECIIIYICIFYNNVISLFFITVKNKNNKFEKELIK